MRTDLETVTEEAILMSASYRYFVKLHLLQSIFQLLSEAATGTYNQHLNVA
jgi:hypothetical protein